MQRVYDGFYPTSNGALVPEVDVPVVHLPTMLEVAAANITDRADSDEPGKQYRMYQVAGMAHIDTRDSVRLKPNPCALPLSEFPHQAYVAVGLHHLLQWVDKGTAPPRAERIARDNDEQNDGSRMALDEHGNPRGGIRTPYVDVPVAKYGLRPAAATPLIPIRAPTSPRVASRRPTNVRPERHADSDRAGQAEELYKTKKNYASSSRSA